VKIVKRTSRIGLAMMVSVMLLAVGTTVGQEAERHDDRPAIDKAGAVEELEDGSEGQAEGGEEQGAIVLAQPPYTMNYQGYLTNSSGEPLDGLHDMVFWLYNDESAGTMRWGPETHKEVAVTKGLFQVALGSMVSLQPHLFDEALYLAVQVDGTDLTPRQPLHSVPYAFGLVPGAEVQGDPATSSYALWVENLGTGASDAGLYAGGELYGIYAEEVGGGNVGIFTPDFVEAGGYKSYNDSFLWVPGMAGVLYPDPNCTLYPELQGAATLSCSAGGTKTIYLPITVPGVLYGQEVRVEQVAVYYDLDNAASYITETRLRKLTTATTSDSLISDTTNRTSTTPTYYSLSTTGNYTLTTTSGPLNLGLVIQHDGSVIHDVHVGGVRVRLGHTD
jgi:hypothetical protein